jgi:hypothetical protein
MSQQTLITLILAGALIIAGCIYLLNQHFDTSVEFHPTPTPTITNAPMVTPSIQPTISPSSTPSAGTVSQVKIALISTNDQGKSGPRVGCGDSVVYIDRSISPTKAPLNAALNQLLSIENRFYGQSGLYNALSGSQLKLEQAVIENGVATIKLSGQLSLGGVCDSPRLLEQLRYTALQFSTVKSVNIFLNDKKLEDVLSEK